MSHNNGNDNGESKSESAENNAVRLEARAESKSRNEASSGIEDLTEKTKQHRAEKKASGKSGVTGWGENGGLSSAESLLGHKNSAEKKKDGTVLLKVNEPVEDQRDAGQKLQDFMQAAAKRATDPEGWKTWTQSEINKFSGVWEGLNEAKEETKSAAAAGWKAMTDGTVVRFLSHPDAINEPLFKTVSNVFDAMGRDPNATNKALEALGNAVVKASDDYSKMPDHEKGKVWGKAMFAMINPEGSTEGAEAALKIADKVATHVDKAVMDTVQQSLKAVTEAAPEVAAQTKQMLYDYLKSKGLTGPELEYAGVPKGYFDEMNKDPGPGKDDNLLAMSGKSNEGESLPRKPREGAEREQMPEKNPEVSERFATELKELIGRLSEGERKFLQDHNIDIQPLRRMSDKFPRRQDLAACYDASENTIYVPEEVPRFGKLVPNYDIEFAFRHEFGHAYNLKFDSLGQYISESPEFRAAFKLDIKAISPQKLEELRLEYPTIEETRDEVFSDMYAHATGLQSNNPRSKLMKDLFPNCLRFAKTRLI